MTYSVPSPNRRARATDEAAASTACQIGDCAGTLLVLELAGAVIVAGAIMLPFQPTFAAILAIGVVPLIAYQYWRDVRMLHMPRLAGFCRPDGPALD
jgi:hypothetical protein